MRVAPPLVAFVAPWICLLALGCSDASSSAASPDGGGASTGNAGPGGSNHAASNDGSTGMGGSTTGNSSGSSTGNEGGPDGGAGTTGGAVHPVAGPDEPAVTRGGTYMGFAEKFNRHYTDPDYTPSSTVFVSQAGGGDGSTRSSPLTVEEGLTMIEPGLELVFVRGDYTDVCYELTAEDNQNGTYEAPVVLYGERNTDGTLGVHMTCCDGGRCINLEGASYVAVDGMIMEGGKYGFRSVGIGYTASEHARGNAWLNSVAFDQTADGVLTGASDWAVFERNVAARSGADDGHGIYLSNGSDFNIVRQNNLYDNEGATFQINADPESTCTDVGVEVDDPECDALASDTGGGRGASDFMLIESNYFHHGQAQGSNFTSVRHSVVRNNAFAFWARHGVSFWSETDNPNLGSHHNRVMNNLFLTTNGNQAVQFIVFSNDNLFANNLLLGASESGAAVPSAVWMETDDTVDSNTYDHNFYASGSFDGRTGIDSDESERADFEASWFTAFPLDSSAGLEGFTPSESAPFRGLGSTLFEAQFDALGTQREAMSDIGPLERP